MPASEPKVLLGDSTPSNLTANVLDVIVELVRCVSEIGRSFVEVYEVHRKIDQLERTTEAVIDELDKFRAQAESSVLATAKDSKRAEVRAHGDEVAATVNRMVESWKSRYAAKLAGEQANGEARRDALQATMHGAVETFLVPMRGQAQQWWQRRVLGESSYADTLVVEPIPGMRITMTAQDTEPEVPRRLRTLLGKGTKVQIGFKKKTMLRRSEEPAWLSLDDLVIVESETSPTRARLVLTKRVGGKDPQLTLEILVTDAGPSGSVLLADGTTAALPASDRPTMNTIFEAIMGENRRVFRAPAQLRAVSLDGDEVDDANGMLGVAERMVDTYRPIIAEIADHSPNVDELTIKVERDGKREEAWIRRDELAASLDALPEPVRERLAIAELSNGAGIGGGTAVAAEPLAATPEFDPDTSLDDLPTFDAPGGLADLLEPEAEEAAAAAAAASARAEPEVGAEPEPAGPDDEADAKVLADQRALAEAEAKARAEIAAASRSRKRGGSSAARKLPVADTVADERMPEGLLDDDARSPAPMPSVSTTASTAPSLGTPAAPPLRPPGGGLPKPSALPRPKGGLPKPHARAGGSKVASLPKPGKLDVPRPLGAPEETASPVGEVTSDISISEVEMDEIDDLLGDDDDDVDETRIRTR